jgi:hypothetical protein
MQDGREPEPNTTERLWAQLRNFNYPSDVINLDTFQHDLKINYRFILEDFLFSNLSKALPEFSVLFLR